MSIIGVIPARYQSSRFEGKPLADIHGKPMIQHVYERASRAQLLDRVLVATDDIRIFESVRAFGGAAIMTRPDHSCGADRIAEVVFGLDVSIVVNIQGDEPLIDPEMIDECVRALSLQTDVEMSTLVKQIDEERFHDPGVVKVVRDIRERAIYFSRSLIPYPRYRTSQFRVFEHIGLYAYTKACLLNFTSLAQTPLELIEGLEQLRAIENGIAIQAPETATEGELISVDTPADLERVREIVAKGLIV
jgi:3-deoxy-manno-octulosonate cytidylyltransferase (CMP-KDO synthetase)